jgi:(R,R)-butanediol dehydrogenase/meso-butanediol dehydrogenase/diacetyl reductase
VRRREGHDQRGDAPRGAIAAASSYAEFAQALAALRTGAIDVAPLVTDVIDLADVPEAFRALERPSTQCKVLIEFP